MAEQTSRLVIEISAEHAKRNAEALNRELQSIEKNGDFATKSMDAMSVATRSLAAQMTALVSVGALVSKMDAYTNLQNRLKLVTSSQTELNKAMNDTFAIAQKTRQSWDAAAQVYQGFANNAKTLGLTMKDTARLTETVSKAVAISGASSASAEAALIQFNQALSSGTLRGEELNSVMEQTPALAKAIADGMGITIGQLRTVAATGAITSDTLVKALEKASKSVDVLFDKTDPTIGQSFTMLNNEVSKFVGEAGKASGAATLTAETIKTLAENLDLVANSAAVVGIGLLTKTILAKSVAVRDSVVASAQNRAALLAENQAHVQALGVEALRTKQLAALAATEINLARAEYNAATSATARAAAVQRLTAAEVAHSIAMKEATVATNAYTVAQTRLNAVASLSSRALSLVGGPIGAITIGVTALAAGYMYFQDKAAKANEELNRQSDYAQKTTEDLQKLSKAQKSVALDELKEKFKDQNEELDRQARLFANAVGDVAQYNNQMGNGAKVSSDLYQIQAQLRAGTLSMSEAMEKVNDIAMITPEQRAQMIKQIEQYNTMYGTVNNNANAQKALGVEVKVAGNAAQNAAAMVDQNTEALNKNETAADKAAKAQKGFFDKLSAQSLQANINYQYASMGLSENQIKVINDLYAAKQAAAPAGTSVIVTQAEIERAIKLQASIDAVGEKEKEITKQKEEQAKLLEKQQKTLQVNAKVMAASQKYNFSGLESKYNLPSGLLSAVMMQESRGNANAIGTQTKYGTAKGGFQMLDGTASRFGLKGSDVFDTGKSAEAAAKYFQFLLDKFKGNLEKAIRAYHAGEGNVERGTGMGKVNNAYAKNVQAYMAGTNGFTGESKDFQDFLSLQVKTNEEINKMRDELANADVQRLNAHNKKIAELTKNFTGQERDTYIMQENQRYAASDSLAKLQFEAQVNGWKWVGEQRITEQAKIDRLTIQASTDLTEVQKQIAKENIDEQAKYEIEQFRKTTQAKIAEYSARLNEVSVNAQNRVMQSLMQNASNDFGLKRTAIDSSYSASMATTDKAQAKFNKGISESNDLDDAEKRKAIIDAEKAFNDERYANEVEYAQKVKDLDQQQYETKLQIYSQISGMVAQTFDQMASMLKESVGESNALYKTMFLAGKAASIAQAIVNTEEGATKALAQGGAYGSILAGVVRATGYASVGIMAGQTIAGMAHNGIDNIPNEGTWLLDGGERVLNPKQNQDLTQYLNDRQNNQSGLNITINNSTDAEVSASQNSDGSVTIDVVDKRIKNAFNNMNNPNSFESKQVQRNFNTSRNRK